MCGIGTVFSPDDGHIVAPKHVEKSNKHIKKICAPSWFYLQDPQPVFFSFCEEPSSTPT